MANRSFEERLGVKGKLWASCSCKLVRQTNLEKRPEKHLMSTALVSYQNINRDLASTLKRTQQQPLVSRESEYYLANISDIKSVDEFLADERLYRYAMKASGLEDMTFAKAFIRKVLEEGIDNTESFANSLADKRYKEFAERFNFDRYGATATTFTRAQQGTVDSYVRQVLEESAGEENEGVRLALYFQRKASGIDNTLQLLADPALLKVAETLFSLNLSSGDVDRNAERITQQLDIEDLKDPEKLAKLLTRFTAMWEIVQPSSTPTSNISLLFNQSNEAGISQNLLSSIQNLKLNGN